MKLKVSNDKVEIITKSKNLWQVKIDILSNYYDVKFDMHDKHINMTKVKNYDSFFFFSEIFFTFVNYKLLKVDTKYNALLYIKKYIC